VSKTNQGSTLTGESFSLKQGKTSQAHCGIYLKVALGYKNLTVVNLQFCHCTDIVGTAWKYGQEQKLQLPSQPPQVTRAMVM